MIVRVTVPRIAAVGCARRRRVVGVADALAAMLAVLVAAAAPSAGAEVFKCRGADGRVTYTDAPCNASAKQETVKIQRGPAAPSPAPASAPPGTPATPTTPGDAASTAAKAPPVDCSRWAPPPWQVRVDPPRAPDLSAYPKDAQGRTVVARSGNVILTPNRKRDLLAVISACAAMVDDCFHRGGDPRNSFDACFNSAPRCRSAKPWEEDAPCCPEACWQAYAKQRRQCADPLGASLKVFYDEHCALETGAAAKR
jgi:hypothetical protein